MPTSQEAPRDFAGHRGAGAAPAASARRGSSRRCAPPAVIDRVQHGERVLHQQGDLAAAQAAPLAVAAPSSSRPSKSIAAGRARGPAGSRSRTALAVSDLPLPDSPTMPIVSPSPMAKSTPGGDGHRPVSGPGGHREMGTARASTAVPLCGGADRPDPAARTARRGGRRGRWRDRGQDQRQPRPQGGPEVLEDDRPVLGEHPAPVGRARGDAETEEGKRGEVDDPVGEAEEEAGRNHRGDVRQEVDEHHPQPGETPSVSAASTNGRCRRSTDCGRQESHVVREVEHDQDG